jgi:DNA-binding NarL/FixJ family response regulator
MAELRIYIADDYGVVRAGVKALVDAQPGMRVVGVAADGRVACREIQELQPDVALLDISMPEWGGARATAELKRCLPDVKVIALTVHEDESYLRGLLEAGASGYVLKRSTAEELIHAIRTVAAGGIYLDPRLAGKLVSVYVEYPSSAEAEAEAARHGELTEREAEVVRLIAMGHSNKEIAARLSISIKTVETHKARSLEKLNLHSRADLVRYTLQRGWLRHPES